MDRRGNDCRTSGFRFWIAPSLPRLDHIPVLHQNAILDPENVRGYPIYWQAETRKPARSETQAHRITGDPSAIVSRYWLLAQVSECQVPLRVACACALGRGWGVSELYRQPGMPQTVCWVGWFAIRSGIRRQGLGRNTMYALIDFAKGIQAKELWFIRVRRMTLQSTFTRVSASSFWAALLSGRLGELWMIRTSY